jgi:hypothetical protein
VLTGPDAEVIPDANAPRAVAEAPRSRSAAAPARLSAVATMARALRHPRQGVVIASAVLAISVTIIILAAQPVPGRGTSEDHNAAPSPVPAVALTDPGSEGVGSVAFNPDGKTLAAGDYDGTAYLWNLPARTITGTRPQG